MFITIWILLRLSNRNSGHGGHSVARRRTCQLVARTTHAMRENAVATKRLEDTAA